MKEVRDCSDLVVMVTDIIVTRTSIIQQVFWALLISVHVPQTKTNEENSVVH